MKKCMLVAMVMGAVGILLIAQLSAGEPGKVILNKDVYKTGEGEATVTVTDGTDGYKAGGGIGFERVGAGFSGAGTHSIEISDEPSDFLNDSGVTVSYPAPASGENEKSVTNYCTVVGPVYLKDDFEYIDIKRSKVVRRIETLIKPDYPGKLPFTFTLTSSDPNVASFRRGSLRSEIELDKSGEHIIAISKPRGVFLAADEKSKTSKISYKGYSNLAITAKVLNAPPVVDLGENEIFTGLTTFSSSAKFYDLEGGYVTSCGGEVSTSFMSRVKYIGGLTYIIVPEPEIVSVVCSDTKITYTLKYPPSSLLGEYLVGTSTVRIGGEDQARNWDYDTEKVTRLDTYGR